MSAHYKYQDRQETINGEIFFDLSYLLQYGGSWSSAKEVLSIQSERWITNPGEHSELFPMQPTDPVKEGDYRVCKYTARAGRLSHPEFRRVIQELNLRISSHFPNSGFEFSEHFTRRVDKKMAGESLPGLKVRQSDFARKWVRANFFLMQTISGLDVVTALIGGHSPCYLEDRYRTTGVVYVGENEVRAETEQDWLDENAFRIMANYFLLQKGAFEVPFLNHLWAMEQSGVRPLAAIMTLELLDEVKVRILGDVAVLQYSGARAVSGYPEIKSLDLLFANLERWNYPRLKMKEAKDPSQRRDRILTDIAKDFEIAVVHSFDWKVARDAYRKNQS